MLETYMQTAGSALKNELSITTADMRTGNYEAALKARVGSAHAVGCGERADRRDTGR